MANTDKYTINYDDQRFKDIKNAESSELSALDNQYGVQGDGTYKGGLIGDAEKIINDQIKAADDYKEEQTKLQNEQTDFIIKQINQDKEKAEKDYQKEQRASYTDYTKATDRYGVKAEEMAASGLLHSGYSESYKSRAYVAHQNRVAVAKSTFDLAVQNYNNKITDAKLQNNATLAEIAYNTLVKQSELALQLITTKSELLSELTSQKNTIKTLYQNKWNAVLDQMNKENTLKQQQYQWEEEYKLKERELDIAEEKWDLEKKQYEDDVLTGSGSKSQGQAATERARAKRESKNTTTSTTVIKTKEPTVDQASLNNAKNKLIKAGIYCNNSAQLNECIRRGFVIEEEKDGKLYYKVASNLISNKGNLPEVAKKKLGVVRIGRRNK